jgi:hypothetical protein
MNLKSMIIIFIVIGVIVLGYMYYTKQISPPCSILPESLCIKFDDCRANYGTSGKVGQYLTTDIRFDSCVNLTSNELEQISKDQLVCDQTGGIWRDERFIHPGRCECATGREFINNFGCR